MGDASVSSSAFSRRHFGVLVYNRVKELVPRSRINGLIKTLRKGLNDQTNNTLPASCNTSLVPTSKQCSAPPHWPKKPTCFFHKYTVCFAKKDLIVTSKGPAVGHCHGYLFFEEAGFVCFSLGLYYSLKSSWNQMLPSKT